MKKQMVIVLSVLALSAGAMGFTGVSAAELAAKEPAGEVSSVGRDYKIALINADQQGNKDVVPQAIDKK